MAPFLKFMLFSLCIFAYHEMAFGESAGLLSGSTKYLGYAGKAISIGKAVYEGADKLYKKLQPKTTKESESDQKIEAGMEQRLTDQIKHVSKKLDSLKVNIQNMKDEIIDKIANEIPDQVTLKNNLFEIYLRINQIENLYENFVYYVTAPKNYTEETLHNFAEHATSHDLNELPNVLKTMHWMLIQSDISVGESILTMLAKSTQTSAQMCKRRQSIQQLLYNLFNTIALADIKGITMIQTSYTILETLTEDDHSGEKALAEQQFINRITNTLRAVKTAMASASRAVWACDTYEYKEDVTYTQLKYLFQKYIINEVDMSPVRTCTYTCPDWKRAIVRGCYDGKICAHQRECIGQLWDCEHKVGSKMYICPADANKSRRYEYIEYGNSQRFGPPGTCSKPAIKVSGWTRGIVACSYCMCTCDDYHNSNSDRYVNLRVVAATETGNYVVTGVRFRKVNHIIHIQIQEGKLLPGGEIDTSSVQWKPIESYKVGKPMPDTEGTQHEYIPREDVDYHALEWKVNKTNSKDELIRKAGVNLDDVDYGEHLNGGDYVVTGLRFYMNVVESSGKHLNLEVLMSPFDINTGLVNYQNTPYATHRNALHGLESTVLKADKTEVKLDNLDVPINSGARAVPTSKTNQYLYFTTSSWETDAGQSTIPFIDLQSVETNPPVPLSGLGLIHKSSPGSGGFLSLKVFTYNYEPRMQEDVN